MTSVFALILLGIGCGDGKFHPEAEGSAKGTASFALTNDSGDCATGTIEIRDESGDDVLYTFPTSCESASHTVPLLPETYGITMADGYTCTPAADTIPDGAEYLGCTLNPVANFTITAGETTYVELTFTFHFRGADDAIVVFTVGEAVINQGPSNGDTILLCGGVQCASNQRCAILDGVLPHCYTVCTTSSECAVGEGCFQVADLDVIFTSAPIDPNARLCVNPGNAGTGGTGGSTSTGGTSSGGVTSTGGATTGGTPGTGGSAGTPSGMTCSVPGMRSSCSTDGCVAGFIICGWDSVAELVWSACICSTDPGTGGSPSTGGTSSTGGTTATGGTVSTGGTTSAGGTTSTGGTSGGDHLVRIEYTLPTTFGNGTSYASSGGATVNAWYGTTPWGLLCGSMTSISGSNVLVCERRIPSGPFVFQVNLLVPYGSGGCVYTENGVPTGTARIFWGDSAYTPCGGNGSFIGSARVFVDGVERSIDMRLNSNHGVACAIGQFCNGSVTI